MSVTAGLWKRKKGLCFDSGSPIYTFLWRHTHHHHHFRLREEACVRVCMRISALKTRSRRVRLNPNNPLEKGNVQCFDSFFSHTQYSVGFSLSLCHFSFSFHYFCCLRLHVVSVQSVQLWSCSDIFRFTEEQMSAPVWSSVLYSKFGFDLTVDRFNLTIDSFLSLPC